MLIVESDILKAKSKVSLFLDWQLHRPVYCFASRYRLCVASHNLYRGGKHYAALMTASQPISENLSSTETHPLQASILPRLPARDWDYHSQYPLASRLSITPICSTDLFACPVCDRTHKLLTNFSKNWFYLLPGPLRHWKN